MAQFKQYDIVEECEWKGERHIWYSDWMDEDEAFMSNSIDTPEYRHIFISTRWFVEPFPWHEPSMNKPHKVALFYQMAPIQHSIYCLGRAKGQSIGRFFFEECPYNMPTDEGVPEYDNIAVVVDNWAKVECWMMILPPFPWLIPDRYL